MERKPQTETRLLTAITVLLFLSIASFACSRRQTSQDADATGTGTAASAHEEPPKKTAPDTSGDTAGAPQPTSSPENLEPTTGPPTPDPDKPRLNVFLFVIDTLRSDSLEPYGAEPGRSPFIGELADQGVVFTQAYSTSSWTVPAMYSIITGLYPREHGVDRGGVSQGGVVGQRVLPDRAVTLAERLKSAGYATFGINTNQHLHPRFGFAQGFDHYMGEGFLKLPFTDLSVDSIAEQVRRASHSFVWVLWLDPHHPYRVNSPWFEQFNSSGFNNWNAFAFELANRAYRVKKDLPDDTPIPPEDAMVIHRSSRWIPLADPNQLLEIARKSGPEFERRFIDFMRAAYDSEVARVDESVRRTFERFGVGDDDLVIIASDHGEEFNERGAIGHRFRGSLYQELVHVPLIVLLPGREHAGKVVSTPVSLVDILPTILEVADIPIDESEHSGVSLLSAISGGEKNSRVLHGELIEPLADVRFRLEWPWKYTHNFTRKSGELYRLDNDPGEQRDMSTTDPRRAERMLAGLLSWMERTTLRWTEQEIVPLSSQEIEQLRALGYLH